MPTTPPDPRVSTSRPDRSEEHPLSPDLVPSTRRLAVVAAVEVAVSALVLWAVLVWPSPLAWYVDLLLALVVPAAAIVWWWWTGPDRVLRSLPVEAADERRNARYANLVDGLCLSFGVEPPTLHVLADDGLNAATVAGRGSAHLVCSTGLLERLDRVSLEGVLAHELAHLRSGDAAAATGAVTLIGYPLLGGNGPVGRTLQPVGAALAPLRERLYLWCLGPERELEADLVAVHVTRYPPGLYQALVAIQRSARPMAAIPAATAPLWIQDPRDVTRGTAAPSRPGLHPPLEQRIDVLGEL